MSEYTFSNQTYQENNRPEQPESTGKRNHEKKHTAARLAKKACALTLSAALFGTVAAGTFQGVNRLIGSSKNSAADAITGDAAVGNTTTGDTRTALADGAEASANTDSSGPMTTSLSPSDSDGTGRGSLDVSDIAEAVMPSIVSITNKSVQEVQNYFSRFGYGGQTQPQEVESCGSGIIIGQNDTELLIVTNYHVVEEADSLSACFIDNKACEANVKGVDSSNDLAVIAIPLSSVSEDTMSQIRVASIGNSDSLKVGEQVVAIGNALGYGQSVTTGIVSATNRIIGAAQSSDNAPTYIQTDAAINPGNSGGALVNMNGEVVGINSAKLASTEVEGMGYAIPVSRVSEIIEDLMNKTTRTRVDSSLRGCLGISAIAVTDAVSQAYGIPTGVYVAEVTEGSAAEKAGLRKGDVITSFDGETVTDIIQLQDILQYYQAGEIVQVKVESITDGSYQEKTVTVTLSPVPDSTGENSEKS